MDDDDWESISSEEETKVHGDKKRRVYSLVEATNGDKSKKPNTSTAPKKERNYGRDPGIQRREHADKAEKQKKTKEKVVINQKLKGDLAQRIQ